MTKKAFINNLFTKRSIYSDADQAVMAANLLDTVSSDIYSESQRFVFELIQNADDSAIGNYNEVHFDFLTNCIIVSHNGNPFNEEDIKSLTSAGSSTKKADSNKTGYKGIGFKSVFGKSERVIIISDNYQFRFDKKYHQDKLPWQIIPIWTEVAELELNIQNSIAATNYNVSTIIELSKPETLQKELKDLLNNGQILLFLRRVTKISVSINGEPNYSIEKKITNNDISFDEVTLFKKDRMISSWIIKTFDGIPITPQIKEELKKDDKSPDKLKEIDFTELSIAARVEEDKIKTLKKGESLIFTYLPTKVTEFEFPFLINGSFLTNAPREALHEDRIWNQWLFSQIAEKIFDWLSILSVSKYKYQLLNLLPEKFSKSQNELKNSFNNSFQNNVSIKPFIITAKENVKKVNEVVLDKTELSNQEFIQHSSIIDFIEIEKKKKFSNDCFINKKLENANKLKAIGVETFELENFEKFFESVPFTSRHNIDDNYSLIQYCKEQSDNDKQGIWFQKLKHLPFIFDENKILYNPSNGICFPVGIKSTELGEVPIIHPTIFDKIQKHNSIFDWLKLLGVKEPSELAYVTNVIIPNIKSPDFINNENYFQITHYLFRLFNNNQLDEIILEGLRELKLKTIASEACFQEAQHCFLSNKYQPHLRIEGLIDSVSFVSEDYIKTGESELKWNLFFKAIKVKDRIEVELINQNNSLPTLRVLTNEDWVQECKTKANGPGAFGFGEHNIIKEVKIPSFLNKISENYNYCKLFWKNITEDGATLKNLTTKAIFKYGVGWGENSFSVSVENYFPWFIRNQKCIPTTSNEILKPEEVFINDNEIKQIAGKFLPVFDFDKSLPEGWKAILPFKKNIELEDYLNILIKISEQSEEVEQVKKSNIKKIGLIYNKLSRLIPNLSEEKKIEITKWAETNKLLSKTGQFEIASQLSWIIIKGFSTTSDKIKIIELPENSEYNSKYFKELISLFGIQIINEFKPKFQNLVQDSYLKNKLQLILPYFVEIISKKKYVINLDEFERIYSILNTTIFYTASDIKLSFNYHNEAIEGQSLNFFRDTCNFYYKGNFKSPLTMFTLIPELTDLLEINGLDNELRLLLELEEEDIRDWLKESDYILTNILSIREFNDSNNIIYSNNQEFLVEEEVYFEDDFNNKNDNDLLSSLLDENSENLEQETFNPDFLPNEIDTSNTSAISKIYFSNNILTEQAYSTISNNIVREEIGRWCEEFIYNYLSRNEKEFSEITWENKILESGKPYDIKIKKNGIDKFIDVKGTPSINKTIIYLSENEWKFMFEKGENYSIYRLYNAGKNDATIEIIENPSKLIQEGKIFPNPITLQI